MRDGVWWYIEVVGVEWVNVWEMVLVGGNCCLFKGWQVVWGLMCYVGIVFLVWWIIWCWLCDCGVWY